MQQSVCEVCGDRARTEYGVCDLCERAARRRAQATQAEAKAQGSLSTNTPIVR